MNQSSATELLMRAHAKDNMPVTDYHVMTSVWVAENTNQYSPRIYPSMPDTLKNYAAERSSGARPRDKGFHGRLGEWVMTTIRLREQNDSDLSLLLWCTEQLKGKAVGNAPAKLLKQVERFHVLQFPYGAFEQALKAQALDIVDKEREEKGRAR